MTKAEAAHQLGISRQTLFAWIRKGTVKLDNDGNIAEAEVERLKARQPSRQADTAKRLDVAASYESRIADLQAHIGTLRDYVANLEHRLIVEQQHREELQTVVVNLTSTLRIAPWQAPREPLALASSSELDEPCLTAIEPVSLEQRPDVLDITRLPTFNEGRFFLGTLCRNRHAYEGTGQSLRYLRGDRECTRCKAERDARHKKRT